MAEISSYPKIQPKAQDLLLGSRTYVEGVDEFTGNPTSVFTVKGIVDLVSVEAGGVSGTVGKIPVFTTATSVGNSIITQNASKIGIKTDNPQRELHVSGGVRITSVLDLFQGNDNTFAGTDAGNLFNIVGSFNTAFGKNSQAVQLNGNSNSSLGFDSLAVSASGNNNTAIGTNSMALSNGGSFNTSVGSNSLNKATVGQGNTAIGFSALGEKTSSNFNTAVGNSSLSNITTGFRNTAVGNDAGKFTSDGTTANSTGRNSIFIGDSAKAGADNQTNQIVIGVGAVGNGDNTTTIGSAGTISTEIKGNVGIGINIPSQKLHVDGSARVTGGYYDSSNSQGTSGQVLSSTGSGTTWVTPTSGGTGTVTSVSGTGTVSGLTLTGTVTSSGDLTLGGTLALTSANVTTGLGFTPYNATNPAGYTDLTLGTTSSTALAGNTTTISSPQAQAIATSVRFDTDNFVSTPPVNKIITLTQAEYTAITTPNVNTLYIII